MFQFNLMLAHFPGKMEKKKRQEKLYLYLGVGCFGVEKIPYPNLDGKQH